MYKKMRCEKCHSLVQREGSRQKYCKQCSYNLRLERNKEWSEKNKEKVKQYRKRYKKEYRQKNIERIKEYNREYCANNRHKRNEYNKQWIEENKDRYRERINRWERRKNETDPLFNIRKRLSRSIRQQLKKNGADSKGTTTEQILGCSWDEFQRHIERQFPKGMTWGNRDRWHIDHIVPLASAEIEADVIALNHYTNLRPLWAEDNLAKRDQMVYLI